ncbi:MAG: hypothetical protein NTV34_03275, partial [Proteobacteria bacterium]|nr:hypothetical protein [Pseudomonadota bacterium]
MMFQKSKFLVFNTLVCAMTIASGASASPIPQPIPGERQNGGDPVLVKFIEGVGIATLILDSTSGTDWTLPDHIPPELIRKGMDRDSLTGWVATHHEELLEDLRGIEVGLATAEQTSCAQTSSEPKSKVIVSSTLCAPQIVDSSAAAWVLLGEAAHHVDAANRETWSQAEENVFAAFITLSARMSFEAFRITPQNLVRQYQCEKASLQSNSIKLAITQLNLLGVKRIVEEGFPIWNGLVDKNCKVTASATSIAAGSQYLIEIGAKPDSVNKTMVAFEILRYVIEKSGAWDIEISGKIFDGFRNGYKSSVVASYGKVIDSIYVFYLNGRHDSGFSSTVFADYVLTYNRDNLLDLLSTVRDEIDYPSMIAKLFLYGPKVSDSLVLFLQSQGVDFESTWASDLCETLLGEVILTETARYNTAALLSQGVKPGEANKPKLVLKAVNLLRSIDVNN